MQLTIILINIYDLDQEALSLGDVQSNHVHLYLQRSNRVSDQAGGPKGCAVSP